MIRLIFGRHTIAVGLLMLWLMGCQATRFETRIAGDHPAHPEAALVGFEPKESLLKSTSMPVAPDTLQHQGHHEDHGHHGGH